MGPLGRGAKFLPALPPASEQGPLASFYPAKGNAKASVSVLEGCVMPNFFGRVNRATVEVLQACQRDVHVPQEYNCCGALHAHNGDLETARKLARKTIESFEKTGPAQGPALPVIVNSAGCGAQMKEYGRLLADDPQFAQRAQDFSQRVRDFNEYLAEEAGEELSQALAPDGGQLQAPITFDDPCHLCHGQGVRSQPRELLAKLGVQRVEIEESESCCGSAGLYATLRPKDSQRMLAPRLDALADCKAKTLVTSNPGCQLQWQGGVQQRSMEVEVLHVAEALQRSLKK
jgi:glycolate oxidase iron-sulfur subunit